MWLLFDMSLLFGLWLPIAASCSHGGFSFPGCCSPRGSLTLGVGYVLCRCLDREKDGPLTWQTQRREIPAAERDADEHRPFLLLGRVMSSRYALWSLEIWLIQVSIAYGRIYSPFGLWVTRWWKVWTCPWRY